MGGVDRRSFTSGHRKLSLGEEGECFAAHYDTAEVSGGRVLMVEWTVHC